MFEERIQTELVEVHESGLTIRGVMKPEFFNVYGIAHGGYLYTLAHIAAEQAGALCLGGSWEVSDVSCQYLHPLRAVPGTAVAERVDRCGDMPVFRVKILDARGAYCYEQMTVLKRMEDAAPIVPPAPQYEHLFPKAGERVTYAQYLRIYRTETEQERVIYTVDHCDQNADRFGAAHPGAMFTAADAATSGCMFFINGKNPITVSANMHYICHPTAGPVRAVPTLLRAGRILHDYNVDMIDSEGNVVACGQFIVRNLDH